MRTPARFFRHAAVAAITAALVASSVPVAAFAEDTDLESLQNAAIAAGEQYDQAQQELDSLQQQIDDNEARIEEIEDQLPELKANASNAIATSYKIHQDQNSLLALLLSADTFNDFITQLAYLNHIVGNATNDMNDLVAAQQELTQKQAELSQQKADEEAKVQAAKDAYDSANAAIEAAKEKAMENAAAQEAAYEAEQAKGQQDATVTEIQEATQDSSSDSSAQTSTQAQETSSQSQQQDTSSQSSAPQASAPASSSSSSSSAAPAASYTYVEASMYGEGDGLMYGTTASGDTLTPTSMGVAMKTMPLGTIIEITYNGRTVTAVVNDRGPYSGNRQIDMQPAVASALGFSGVGTVGYRVVS
ncbi:RlpA-like double-psi beta-barrel domain-containing protein [Olsenella sp. YH-ols2221]|jgi:rare lipoprotein A (peptidoglycan hydrolase)